MSFSAKLIVLLSLLFNFSARADVEMHLPYKVDLILVNGSNKIPDLPLTISSGQQQLVFKLTANYRALGRKIEFVSDAIILTTHLSDGVYRIQLPKIRNDKAAQAFNKKPEISITNAAGMAQTFEQGKLMKNGLQMGRDYLQEIYFYNKAGLPGSVLVDTQPNNKHYYHIPDQPQISRANATTTKPKAQSIDTTITPQPLSTTKQPSTPTAGSFTPKTIAEDQAEIEMMLNYWYEKASPTTRAKFLENIKK